MKIEDAIAQLEWKAGNMRILANAERTSAFARGVGEKMLFEAEAIELLCAKVREFMEMMTPPDDDPPCTCPNYPRKSADYCPHHGEFGA